MYSKPDHTTFNVDGMDILIMFILLQVNLLPRV
jgi:hypothetical protein